MDGLEEVSLPLDHSPHVVGMLQQIGRHQRHVLWIGGAQPHRPAGFRLHHDGRDGEAMGLLHEAQRVAVEIDDGDAEGLDGRFCVGVLRIDEGTRLDTGGGDGARTEQLELQPVEQHPPTHALPMISECAVCDGNDRHLRMVDQVLANAR